MAVTASFLVGQHVHERIAPRVERAWLEGAGVGAFRRVHVRAYVRSVRRAWLGAIAIGREPQPIVSGQCVRHKM